MDNQGRELSGKALGKANKQAAAQAQQQALQAAVTKQQRGEPLTATEQSVVNSANDKSESRSAAREAAGIGAVGGLASGALQALLTKNPERARNALPSGGATNITRGSVPDDSMSRISIGSEQRPSLALEMLRKGGYK